MNSCYRLTDSKHRKLSAYLESSGTGAVSQYDILTVFPEFYERDVLCSLKKADYPDAVQWHPLKLQMRRTSQGLHASYDFRRGGLQTDHYVPRVYEE